MNKSAIHKKLLENYDSIKKDTIDEDFILIDDISSVPSFDSPYMLEKVVATICLKGSIHGLFNQNPFLLTEKQISLIFPGQFVEYGGKSNDFSALLIIISKQFGDNFQITNKNLSVFVRLKESPIIDINDEELETLVEFYNLLRKIVRAHNNPYRKEMISRLAEAFFYFTINLTYFQEEHKVEKSRKEILFKSFYDSVLIHYKESRMVTFYADKLCITPKYLSKIIKSMTGKSANDWIDEYVILEAKSLLRSTDMTILEISEQLGFPSQSFFGRYFKDHTKMSPKEYRSK